jgi:TPR repeat protein
MVNLGIAFREGKGVPMDARAAVSWFPKAAERGEADGMFNVGVMLANGVGVIADAGASRLWLMKAAALGHGAARRALVARQ